MDSIFFFTELIKGLSHPKLFLLLLCDSMNRILHRFWFCGCPTSYMSMYVLLGVWSWFYSCELERDRHYAKWKKAVKRTMKWEVNDDEDQGKKIWSNSIYHHNCMFVFTLVCLLRYCTVTWNRQQTLQGGYFGWIKKTSVILTVVLHQYMTLQAFSLN